MCLINLHLKTDSLYVSGEISQNNFLIHFPYSIFVTCFLGLTHFPKPHKLNSYFFVYRQHIISSFPLPSWRSLPTPSDGSAGNAQ